MKKMNFASVSCEIAVADNFYFSTENICEYGRDTVRYAVERFFAKNIGLQRKCTWESWKIRVGKEVRKTDSVSLTFFLHLSWNCRANGCG